MSSAGDPDAADGALRLAYDARSRQLLEARAALARAIDELAAITAERDVLRSELASAHGMKVVRWSAPLRRAVYRLRASRR